MSYRTEPDHQSTAWPKGIKYIVGNEAAERFSYYGMTAILYLYLHHMFMETGMADVDAGAKAKTIQHTFFAGLYATPVLGAVLADRFFGKYSTILYLSLSYCVGHALLAIGEGSMAWTGAGLFCIALGAGGIKPCVGAHVGDQFGHANRDKLTAIFQIFYFTINLGAFSSMLLIPMMRGWWGHSVAFAVPGVLMGVATVVFWLGRREFVHVPAKPGGKLGLLDVLSGWLFFMAIASLLFFPSLFGWYSDLSWWGRLGFSALFVVAGYILFQWRQRIQEDDGFLAVLIYSLRAKIKRLEGASDGFFKPAAKHFGDEAATGPAAVLRIVLVFSLICIFWSLFKQTGSSWTEQARYLHRSYEILGWSVTIAPDQFQAANPILVMLLIPFTAFWLFPKLSKWTKLELTPLVQMRIGMFLTALSFVGVALIQQAIEGGATPSVWWQLPPYIILTLGEVMVSITGLEFAYTQAPKAMKSVIMAFWYMTISLGNKLIVVFTQLDGELASMIDQDRLTPSQTFWFYASLMTVASVLFLAMSRRYEQKVLNKIVSARATKS